VDLFSHADLSDEQRLVYECIAPCQGKAAAIPVAEIIRRTGIQDRKARGIVKELVEEKGHMIASCPTGFYVPVTPEEVREVYRQYVSWGLSLLTRASRIRNSPRLQSMLGQLELELKAAV